MVPGARSGRAAPGDIGSEGEEGNSWMADPEEGLRSGARACNDPLRGICCKAHCRTAVAEIRHSIKKN